jgi:hypothetical protein
MKAHKALWAASLLLGLANATIAADAKLSA